MSDPVTNVEIEDVLSSIRRLVAQGDKPRNGAKEEENNAPAQKPQAERFVLTPALRVAEVDEAETDDEISESDAHAAQFIAPVSEPLVLTPADAMQEPMVHDGMTASERASLEATIAELEAAVTSQPDEWEPDGSEVTPTQVTGLAAAFAAMDDENQSDDGYVDDEDGDFGNEVVIEDAEFVPADPIVTLHPDRAEPTFRHTPADDPDTDYGDDLRDNGDEDGMPIPDDLDETLAAYIAGGSRLEQEEIRQMVVEVVRQELQGELGERITRNIRKLVRKEISRAMSVSLYD